MEVHGRIVERQGGKIIGRSSVKQFFRFGLFLLYVMGGGAAFAQSTQIPQDMLDLDYQRCVNDCVPAYGEVTCTPLCSCTVKEFKKRLDFDAYLELSVQLSGGDISAKSRLLLDEIAQYCAAKIERDGVEIGGPGDEKPAAPAP